MTFDKMWQLDMTLLTTFLAEISLMYPYKTILPQHFQKSVEDKNFCAGLSFGLPFDQLLTPFNNENHLVRGPEWPTRWNRWNIKNLTNSVPSPSGVVRSHRQHKRWMYIYHKTTTLSEHTAERRNRKVSGSEWRVKLPHLCLSTNIWQTDGAQILAV